VTASTLQGEPHSPTYGLRVERRDEGSEAVVRLEGELELSTATPVRHELDRALATSSERIVIDLRALDFLDSTGIQVLVDAHERCGASARSLTLLLAPGPARRALEMCGLLELFDHTSEAIAA
jgi:anti-sigma B factor antagonist